MPPFASAIAANSATDPLTTTLIRRRALGPHDIEVDIGYVGIRHSDLHTVRAEWGRPNHPVVPGHEIAGTVGSVGSQVGKFTVGEPVGVGYFIDSCRECTNCVAGQQQRCAGE